MKTREYYIDRYGLGREDEYSSSDAYEEIKIDLVSLHPDQRAIHVESSLILPEEIERREGQGEDEFTFDPLHNTFHGIVYETSPTYRPLNWK